MPDPSPTADAEAALCPKCGEATRVESHCPATDHPETTVYWDECGCGWESDHRPTFERSRQRKDAEAKDLEER